ALLPQLQRERSRPDAGHITSGLLLMLLGLLKKVVIADSLAPIVNQAFDGKHEGTSVALAGIVAFAFQIYADFSGYTDIARGAACTASTAAWSGLGASGSHRSAPTVACRPDLVNSARCCGPSCSSASRGSSSDRRP